MQRTGIQMNNNQLKLTYNYFPSIQGQTLVFLFLLSKLSAALPEKRVNVLINPNNNVYAYYVQPENCQTL